MTNPPLEADIDTDTLVCDPVQTKRTTPYRPWQDIAADKKAEQLARIPKPWHLPVGPREASEATTDLRPFAWTAGLLTDRELDMTSRHDATSLLARLADGHYTSVEVVTAFCKRAAIAQQVANCLTEIMFADALAEAARLDAEYARTGKVVGPLHGLPMTFKVCIYVYLFYLLFSHDLGRVGTATHGLLVGMLPCSRLRCLGWVHLARL